MKKQSIKNGRSVERPLSPVDFPAHDRLLIDWVSLTSKEHNVEEMKALLGMELAPWEIGYGEHGFDHMCQYGSIRIHFNDQYTTRLTAGFVFLEMSGQGCRTFESDGNGDYNRLFNLVLRDIGKPKEEQRVRLTRLDIAFDDMSGVFDIQQVYDVVRRGEFTSRMKDSRYHGGRVGGIDALSVDFGSKSSNIFIRIYDKAAERGYSPSEISHWCRCELQLRKENAMGFLFKAVDVSMAELYKSVLANYLQFRDPSDTDSNKRRWTISDWWSSFLNDAVPVTVWSKPGVAYNMRKLEDHLFQRNGGALKTYVRIQGEAALLREIRDARDPSNPNYKRLIAEHEHREKLEQERYSPIQKQLDEQKKRIEESRKRVFEVMSGKQIDMMSPAYRAEIEKQNKNKK